MKCFCIKVIYMEVLMQNNFMHHGNCWAFWENDLSFLNWFSNRKCEISLSRRGSRYALSQPISKISALTNRTFFFQNAQQFPGCMKLFWSGISIYITLMQKHLMRTINPGYSQIHCFATGLDYGFPGVPLVCGSSKKGVRLPQHQGLIAVARSK